MTISIVILNWNGKKETLACLKSLQRLHIPKEVVVKIIVVDNASSDDSVSVIRGFSSEVEIIENKENLGYAQGNNIGIQEALKKNSEYVLILNNDTEVDKHLVSELLVVAEKYPNAGIISPKIYFYPGYEFHKDRYAKKELGKVLWYAGGEIDWKNMLASHRGVDEVDHGQYESIETIDFASGCCLFIKAAVFETIGVFDKRYYLYFEDNDFSLRAKKAGFDIMFAPKAILWHKNAGSAGGSGSALQDYYISRNRLLFGMKYAPLRTKIALIRESLRLLQHGRPWQKKGIKDFYLARFGKGSWKGN